MATTEAAVPEQVACPTCEVEGTLVATEDGALCTACGCLAEGDYAGLDPEYAGELREEGMGRASVEEADQPALDYQADRYLERLALVADEQARNDALYKARLADLQAWRASEQRGLEKRQTWLEAELLVLARAMDYGRKKSRNLPHGKLGKRSKRSTVQVLDDEAAGEFAKKQGLPHKVTTTITALKEFVEKQKGKLPEGVAVYVPGGDDEYYVKPTKREER